MANVLITGANRGIGLATALHFARFGYTVLAGARRPEAATALRDAAKGLPVHIVALDVDDDASVANGIAAMEAEHGPLDTVVNNAGIERHGSIEELPLEEFRAVMETNYFGPLRVMKAVLPGMRERRAGTIINISSVAGRLTNAPLAPYSASKWALEAVTEALAGEVLSFGVRVYLAEPGIIATDMAQSLGPGQATSIYPQTARLAAIFGSALANGTTTPEQAAAVIYALRATQPHELRHFVGADAPVFVRWRQSLTDEQWREIFGGDDAGFFAAFGAAFGGPA